jgi:DNA repair protein RecO (recombination protein O)
MSLHSSQAIILQTTDYSEWDRIVSLFTKDFGRIKGIAKGAKRSQKRFGSALEPFTYNDVFFVDKENQGLVRIERCRILNSFPEIAQDLKKVVFGNYFLELANTLTPERESNPDIFFLLMYFIHLLNNKDFREELMRIFEFRLFSLIGYQPQFLTCVACGEEFNLQDSYKFSIRKGGIVCTKCQIRHHDLLPLSKGTIRIFQQAKNLSLIKLNRIFFSHDEHEEGRLIFGKFIEYHMGKKPKSLDVMEQLSEYRV